MAYIYFFSYEWDADQEQNKAETEDEDINKALVPESDQSILQDFTKCEEPQQEKPCKGLPTTNNVLSVTINCKP